MLSPWHNAANKTPVAVVILMYRIEKCDRNELIGNADMSETDPEKGLVSQLVAANKAVGGTSEYIRIKNVTATGAITAISTLSSVMPILMKKM